MIIISQDEEEIINFDNIKEIRISNYEEIRNGKWTSIYFSITVDNGGTLGKDIAKYKTKKQAKEVFDDIVKALYAECRIYNLPKE